MDVAYLLRRAGHSFPKTLAIDDGRLALDMRELLDHAERIANALDALGVPVGGSVVILSENRSEYAVIDAALALGRRVRVALNARLGLADFETMIQESGAQVLVHSASFDSVASALRDRFGLLTISLDSSSSIGSEYWRSLASTASPIPVVRAGEDEDPAWITFTSGTAGTPKGVLLSHRAIGQVALNILLELGPVSEGHEIVLTQPMSHSSGYFLLPYFISGGGVHVRPKFDPEETVALTQRPAVRVVKLVPSMLEQLLSMGQPLAIESIVYGAAPIPMRLLEAALETFGPVLVQIYGQSEAPVSITCLSKSDHSSSQGRSSVGRPWRSVAVELRSANGEIVRAGEVGEVTVDGRHVMSGYLNRKTESERAMRAGWIWMGDIARIDEQGFIHLEGRRDEMINSGGYMIAPREVEQAILERPDIEECAVVGVSHPRWGSQVAALVKPMPNVHLDPARLAAELRSRLGFRTPRRLEIADEIPRTPHGKIDSAAVQRRMERTASLPAQTQVPYR